MTTAFCIATLVTPLKVDMTKLVGVNLASSHTYRDSSGLSYSMGTSLLSGPKYHIIRTPTTPSGRAQDGETALSLFILIYSFPVCLPVFPLNLFECSAVRSFIFLVSSFQL
jgi:hypothetical protein